MALSEAWKKDKLCAPVLRKAAIKTFLKKKNVCAKTRHAVTSHSQVKRAK